MDQARPTLVRADSQVKRYYLTGLMSQSANKMVLLPLFYTRVIWTIVFFFSYSVVQLETKKCFTNETRKQVMLRAQRLQLKIRVSRVAWNWSAYGLKTDDIYMYIVKLEFRVSIKSYIISIYLKARSLFFKLGCW